MVSVLEEIKKLRAGTPAVIDSHNSNRYRLVMQENSGIKTSYCFSTPIYNINTRRLVDMKFRMNGDTIYATGSNADIFVSDRIIMKNADVSVIIDLSSRATLLSSNQAQCGSYTLSATTNGVLVKCDLRNLTENSFLVETGRQYLEVRTNDRCFALMKERFRPLFVLSGVGSLDAHGNVIAPVNIGYQLTNDGRYRITVSKASPIAQSVLFEMNMYENKLFQDTTVESGNPTLNNAFGGVGFIGNSSAYGEQWLYSRLDSSRIPELIDKRIFKAVLHMPKLNKSDTELRAFNVATRFCSFGSSWDNKVSEGDFLSESQTTKGYQSLDVTSVLIDPHTKTLLNSEGLILKSKIKGSGFSVVSTGDSYYAPQILEISHL